MNVKQISLAVLALAVLSSAAVGADAPWVGKVQAPQAETPVEVAPVQEAPVDRDEPPEYATLRRNVNKRKAMPFYERIFNPDDPTLPPGGRKAAKCAVSQLFYGRITQYWADDLQSDFDGTNENFLYRAMALRAAVKWGLKISDETNLLEPAKELYLRRRDKENPFAAAALAAAIVRAESGKDLGESAFREKLFDDALRAVTDATLCTADTVEFVQLLLNLWGLTESQEFLLERVEKRAGEIDPWLLEHLRGTVNYRLAWNARGHGFANTVTREGWRGYAAHIREAEQHLRKAYALRPDILASATALCRIEQPDASKAEQREWRHAGYAARLDTRAIRCSRLFHLTSRWGGSLEKMEKSLDKIAPVDGDYGTVVPAYNVSLRWNEISAYECDHDDEDTRELFFQRSGVKEKTLAVIREYLKPGSSIWLEDSYVRDELWCDFAAAAYCLHDYRLMLECWRRITPGMANKLFLDFNCPHPIAYRDQTMRRRFPVIVAEARRPKLYDALCDACSEFYDGDFTNGLARLSAIGNAEPAGSELRALIADDIHKAIYERVVEDETTISLMDDVLTSADPGPVEESATGMIMKDYEADRTAFRETGNKFPYLKERWYHVKGIRSDFTGSTGWKFTIPNQQFKGNGTEVEFWLGAMFAPQGVYEWRTPVLAMRSMGMSGKLKVEFWEKTWNYDRTVLRYEYAYRYPLTEPVVVEFDFKGETDVQIDFEDGALTAFVNGVQINKVPLDFTRSSRNGWHEFCFRQDRANIVEHWLSSAPEKFRAKEDFSLTPFKSQLAMLPLPTLDFATNELVRTAAKAGWTVFPEYMARDTTWWGTDFTDPEYAGVKDEIAAVLPVALTNEVWKAMDGDMRAPLALRYAALAYQIGDKGLAAEYIDRYVSARVFNDYSCLSVFDVRYDRDRKYPRHGHNIRSSLSIECSPLRAAWWRTCDSGEKTCADEIFGGIYRPDSLPPEKKNIGRTNWGLPFTEDWKLSIAAKGDATFVSYYTRPDNKPHGPTIPKLKISAAKEPGRGMAVCEGAMRDGKLVAPVEFSVGDDGAYVCEIVNKSGTLSFFAGGEEVYSMPSPGLDEEIAPGEERTGFVPAIFRGKIDEIWLERLK